MVRYVFGSTRYFNKFVIKKQSDKASTNLVDRRKDSLNSNTSNSDSITNNEKNNDHFRFRLLTRTRTDQ